MLNIIKKGFTYLAKGINWTLSNIVTVETKLYKRGGAYVVEEKLKLFHFTVDTVETRIKDIVLEA